ncbi:MAG: outer membrane lipoprotein carrier protein LolA [bacterium]|nr:outer membrane lipoprotein carrier protein LolA [bacterium]
MWIIFWLFSLSPLLEKVNISYDKIETLQGEITRYFTSAGNRTQTTIGKFYLKKPNKLFIKYAKPEQTIVLNDTLLWIYLPADKKALKVDYATLSPLEKHLIGVGSFLGLNSIHGLEAAFEFESQDEYTIVAKPKNGAKVISKIVLNVDPQMSVILGAKIFDLKGVLVTSTKYENWKELDGIWFPQRVISNIYLSRKEIKEENNFKKVSINSRIGEECFNFIPPKSIEVVELDLVDKR